MFILMKVLEKFNYVRNIYIHLLLNHFFLLVFKTLRLHSSFLICIINIVLFQLFFVSIQSFGKLYSSYTIEYIYLPAKIIAIIIDYLMVRLNNATCVVVVLFICITCIPR